MQNLVVGKDKPGKIQYINAAFKVIPEGGARDQKGWLVLRPEYLFGRFNPGTIEKDGSQSFVYRANIGFALDKKGKVQCDHPNAKDFYYGKYLIPTLPGLYGEELQRVDDLTNELAVIEDDNERMSTLDADLQTLKGNRVGFFLRQQKTDSKDELDERGRPVKIRTPYYELAGFFTPSHENCKALETAFDKANTNGEQKAKEAGERYSEMYQITYATDVPFSAGAASRV